MPEFTEFVTKSQEDILSAVKQAQDTNIKAIAAFGDAVAEYATKARAFANGSTLPAPAEIVEKAFGFTSQLVELQKNYYVQIAETIATAQRKAFDATAR